jgi:hypothetical protein
MGRRKDDLGELLWIFYGIVAAAVLIVGVVQLVRDHHHTVSYWLVAGSWCVTFAALAWGAKAKRVAADRSGAHLHLDLPKIDPGETYEGSVGGKEFKIANPDRTTDAPEVPEGLQGRSSGEAGSSAGS